MVSRSLPNLFYCRRTSAVVTLAAESTNHPYISLSPGGSGNQPTSGVGAHRSQGGGCNYEFLPGSPPVLSPVPGVTVLVTHSELRFAVSEPVLGRERRQPLAWRDASCPRQATSDTCAVVTMNFCQVALMTLWHLRCYLVRHHKEHLQLAGHCADRDLALSSHTERTADRPAEDRVCTGQVTLCE